MTRQATGLPYEQARAQILREAMGYYAENFPLASAVNSQAMATGTVYATSIPLQAGDPLNNVIIGMSVAASGLTLCRACVFNAAGTSKLLQTGDVTSLVQGGIGRVPLPLTQPFFTPNYAPADGVYLVAVLGVGTTPPTIARGTGVAGIQTQQGGLLQPLSGQQTGQSDIPASLTLTTSGTVAFWVGVS